MVLGATIGPALGGDILRRMVAVGGRAGSRNRDVAGAGRERWLSVRRGGRAGARLDADVLGRGLPPAGTSRSSNAGRQAARRLVDPEGVVIAERTLDGGASCAELGRMAAIVIASWESDVHPEFVRQPAEIARVERAPPPQRVPAAPTPAPSIAAAYDVAAGVTMGQADTLAAGASIGAAWFPRGVGLGGWVLGAGDLARTIAVGTHEARWRRLTASLELAYRWALHGLIVDTHAGPTLGWISTEGVDYTQNRSDSAVSLGGTAGIRTAWWLARRAAISDRRPGLLLPAAGFHIRLCRGRDGRRDGCSQLGRNCQCRPGGGATAALPVRFPWRRAVNLVSCPVAAPPRSASRDAPRRSVPVAAIVPVVSPAARPSFDAVYRAHAKTVSRWASRLLGPGGDCEDVVQEAFIVVRKKLPRFDGRAEITTWLYEITVRVVQDWRRRRRWWSWVTGRGPSPSRGRPQAPPRVLRRWRVRSGGAARGAERLLLVYRILDGLGEEYRTTFILFELEGLSGERIAEIMGARVGTVWVRLTRARRAFIERMRQLEEQEQEQEKKRP